jgi:acetyltransferase-like isoleucine patch superfamily enzyme
MNHLERAAGFQRLTKEGHPKTKNNVLTAPVLVGDYARISFNVCILKGVRIGKGAIVAGGSVVTDDVPEFTFVAGNPAKIIRRLDE